jgi:hypothetical protein
MAARQRCVDNPGWKARFRAPLIRCATRVVGRATGRGTA